MLSTICHLGIPASFMHLCPFKWFTSSRRPNKAHWDKSSDAPLRQWNRCKIDDKFWDPRDFHYWWDTQKAAHLLLLLVLWSHHYPRYHFGCEKHRQETLPRALARPTAKTDLKEGRCFFTSCVELLTSSFVSSLIKEDQRPWLLNGLCPPFLHLVMKKDGLKKVFLAGTHLQLKNLRPSEFLLHK